MRGQLSPRSSTPPEFVKLADAEDPADVGPPHPEPKSARGVVGLTVAIVALVALAATSVAVLRSRRLSGSSSDAIARTTDVGRGNAVQTVTVASSGPVRHVELMGEARPFASVTLYAKVSGYLQTVPVDVGDRVAAGQVVATVESPETDRALDAAKADYDNKAAIAGRVAQLLEKKYVSPEEADDARTAAAVAKQRLASLGEEQAYETLRAPFAGTVTARFADPGALMQNAASSQTSALPVVTIAETDSLRVLVYLDQSDAAAVRTGESVMLSMTERPGVKIPGTVTRLSGELDPKTRKMLVEVDVGDRNGAIVPGSFVQVNLELPTPPQLQAPVQALTVRDGRSLVAVVSPDGVLHFRPVTVASNDGTTVIFGSGVSAGDRLAINVPGGVADGTHVRIDTASASVSHSGGGLP